MRRRGPAWVTAVVVIGLALAGCSSVGDSVAPTRTSTGCDAEPVAPGDYEAVNDAGDANQKYWTIVPSSYEGDPVPLYVFLSSGSGDADANYAAWRPLVGAADGLVVVVDTAPGTGRDVATYTALLDELGQDYCVDLDRIHLQGSSWSSGLTAQLVCLMPDTFGSFGDALGRFTVPSFCEPQPTPLIAVTGDTDRAQVRPSVEYWANVNGCQPDPQVEDMGAGVTRYVYQGCEADVVFYDFAGMTHQLPSHDCMGPADQGGFCAEYADFDILQMWQDFFADHPL
jgi:polyhydroxybutyrate depolymerase